MIIDALSSKLETTGALGPVVESLRSGRDASLGVSSSARPFIISSVFRLVDKPMLVVMPGEDQVDGFVGNIRNYVDPDKVLSFPAREDSPYNAKDPDLSVIARRSQAACALLAERRCIVVCSAPALLRLIPPPGSDALSPIRLSVGQEPVLSATGEILDLEEFLRRLVQMGYVNEDGLAGPGTFSAKGGVVDVYPGQMRHPVRIDFFGDEIDDIRQIIPATGQSIASLNDVEVFPVREYRMDDAAVRRGMKEIGNKAYTNPVWREIYEALEAREPSRGCDAMIRSFHPGATTLGDYASRNCMTVLVEPRSVMDDALLQIQSFEAQASGTQIPVECAYANPAALQLGHGPRLTLVSLMQAGVSLDAQLPVKRVGLTRSIDSLYERLSAFVHHDYVVVLGVANRQAREEMRLSLVDHHLPFVEVLDKEGSVPDRLQPSVVNLTDIDIPLGLVLPKAKIALVSIHDNRTNSTKSLVGKKIDITKITFPFKPGDYVVHAAHGIARFSDIVRRDDGGYARDYLLLEYAQGDKLFVPVEQFDRVTKYVGADGSEPKLTRLNTREWARILTKTHKATKKLAFDLIDVYSRRVSAKGFAFSPDTPWQIQMEEDFPYQETPDQIAAIEQVKADMESGKPMDRLICGDVGFGKTEVALRAAFKAVQDGKQVMVLCPTTILAQQHFTTFEERFSPYGIKVEVLSRFRDGSQQREALKGFSEGSVNVLVGTHRLLSRDVNPKNLGLVIIDEEQRFGVGHKEQLRNYREYLDVLTLSATPIPRTLQMSMSGVKDMSLILTPPEDRRAIEVHVGEWDVDVVSDAIRRELQRHGQVYYVSNRVRTIEDAVARVGEAAGEARIGVAHGQMSKTELETVMEDFSAGRIDVLVATTIIESGIDNPHTNTLIIEDSQRLGLAQMYQLKGRVGRSSTQAYAYFMFPAEIPLTEEARSRLEAINEFTDLGSGMRIALRDLEIRGAGSMLGAEQSGNLSAVGFDLFAQMLADAVNMTKDGKDPDSSTLPQVLSDINVNVPGACYFDEDYITDVEERITLYRRIAWADTVEMVEEIRDQVQEAKGPLEGSNLNMFTRALVRAWAAQHDVRSVSVVGGKLNIEPVNLQDPIPVAYRRAGARYSKQTGKFSIPIRYFRLEEGDAMLGAIWSFCRELLPLE